MMRITPVPQTPAYVKGVLNLRGQVIPVVDLRMKFGMSELNYTERTSIIVVEIKNSQRRCPSVSWFDAVSEVANIRAETSRIPQLHRTGGHGLHSGHGQGGRRGENPAGHRHGSERPGNPGDRGGGLIPPDPEFLTQRSSRFSKTSPPRSFSRRAPRRSIQSKDRDGISPPSRLPATAPR